MNTIQKYFGHLKLSPKQQRFLENLCGEYLELGQDKALEVTNNQSFRENVVALLTKVSEAVEKNQELLEKLALGDWEGVIALDAVIEDLIDEKFGKTIKVVPEEKIELYGMAKYKDTILTMSHECYYIGLYSVLEDWVRRLLMQLCEDCLNRTGETTYASLSEQDLRSRVSNHPIDEDLKGFSEEELFDLYSETYKKGQESISNDLFQHGSLPRRELEARLEKYKEDEDFLEDLADSEQAALDEVFLPSGGEEEFIYTVSEKYFSDFPVNAKKMTNWELLVFHDGMEEKIDKLARKAIPTWAKEQLSDA